MPDYLYKSVSKGYSYYYSRIPGAKKQIRLPDDRVAAVAAVKEMMSKPRRDAIDRYVQHLVTGTKQRAKSKSILNDLSPFCIRTMLASQCYRCAVTDIDFTLDVKGVGTSKFLRAFAPSIDRIDNSRGYTPDNVRIVCRIVNFAMNAWGLDALKAVALALSAKEGV